MAKASKSAIGTVDFKALRRPKKTSIGQSVHSRPVNKQKKRSFKRYRGQGK
jgi:hypothetical protein